MTDDLVQSIIRHSASLSPTQVSQAVWSMISLGINGGTVMSLPIKETVGRMDATSVTRLVHLLHRVLPAESHSLWTPIVETVIGRLPEMSPVEVVTCCHSIAKAGLSAPVLYRHLTDLLVSPSGQTPHFDISTWQPRQVSLLIWCISTSSCVNWDLMNLLLSRLPHLALSPTDVACILSGLARANFVCEDHILSSIPMAEIFSSPSNPPPPIHTLCTCLHSLARLGSSDDRFLASIRPPKHVFPPDMSSWLNQTTILSILKNIVNQRQSVSLRGLSMLAWSLMKLRIQYMPALDLIVSSLSIPKTPTIEQRADLVTIISSLANIFPTSHEHIMTIAHDLVKTTTNWTEVENSTLIHLLWSIGLMDGRQSTTVSRSEMDYLNRLVATTTERADASMLFHYTLLRGIEIEFPFGLESWRNTNIQWNRDLTDSTNTNFLEHTVVAWFQEIVGNEYVRTQVEILAGVFCDVLVNDNIVVEINGPSHYIYNLETGDMRMDRKSLQRNKLIGKKVERIVNLSFHEINELMTMSKEERDRKLRKFIS